MVPSLKGGGPDSPTGGLKEDKCEQGSYINQRSLVPGCLFYEPGTGYKAGQRPREPARLYAAALTGCAGSGDWLGAGAVSCEPAGGAISSEEASANRFRTSGFKLQALVTRFHLVSSIR